VAGSKKPRTPTVVLTPKRATSTPASFGFHWSRSLAATIGKRRLVKKFEIDVRTRVGATFAQPVATGSRA